MIITTIVRFHRPIRILINTRNMSTEKVLSHIFAKSIESVSSKALFNSPKVKSLLMNTDFKDENNLSIRGEQYHLIGFGKAVIGMAAQLVKYSKFENISGIISVPHGTIQQFGHDPDFCLAKSNIKIMEGARNNLPDVDAENAAKEIKELAQQMTKYDVLIVLISGGGSALLPLPMPPITLAEKTVLIKKLASRGATIQEINIVRINLSDMKGGKLAHHARHARAIIVLVISDIVDDPLDLIASGPTVACQYSSNAALEILEKYDLVTSSPASILKVLLESSTPKIHLNNVCNHIIGSNCIAIETARREALAAGYSPITLSSAIVGNVEEISKFYAKMCSLIMQLKNNVISLTDFKNCLCSLRPTFPMSSNFQSEVLEAIQNQTKGICLIGGGEPTVKLTGSGLGGRNQELPLRFSYEVSQSEHKSLLKNVYFLSGGTDGIDGPTTAAGAIGGLAVVEDYLLSNDVESLLCNIKNNNSFNFYHDLQRGKYHVVTGHTGTNVMDLHILILQ